MSVINIKSSEQVFVCTANKAGNIKCKARPAEGKRKTFRLSDDSKYTAEQSHLVLVDSVIFFISFSSKERKSNQSFKKLFLTKYRGNIIINWMTVI